MRKFCASQKIAGISRTSTFDPAVSATIFPASNGGPVNAPTRSRGPRVAAAGAVRTPHRKDRGGSRPWRRRGVRPTAAPVSSAPSARRARRRAPVRGARRRRGRSACSGGRTRVAAVEADRQTALEASRERVCGATPTRLGAAISAATSSRCAGSLTKAAARSSARNSQLQFVAMLRQPMPRAPPAPFPARGR